MALLDDVFKGGTGIAIGVGAALLAPALIPAVGRVVRPVAKAVIKTGISAYREATTQINRVTGPLVQEAQAELAARGE